MKKATIFSVRRKSDDKIFTLGDKINVLISTRVKKPATITEFEYDAEFLDDTILVHTRPSYSAFGMKDAVEIDDIEPIELIGKEQYNPADYAVLNDKTLPENQIAVAVTNFTLMGQSCLMEFEWNGEKYKRLYTGAIPNDLSGCICSVQIYEKLP